MAQSLVSLPMREFMARNGDAPIENSRLQHNIEGETVIEECRGSRARYIRTSADRAGWEELVLPFE